jgi:hypothetical protein
MTTRRSKSYFFSGVYGMTNRLFKKGNKPNQTTYQELTDAVPFINDSGDTAKTTEQGLVKVSSDVQYGASTLTDSGMQLVPTNKQIQDQFLLHYTKIASDAKYGTTNFIHGTGIPSSSQVIKTYYLDTATGKWYLNAGGGSSWSSVFSPDLIFGTCNIENKSGVPSGARDILTYGIDLLTADWYSNPGGGSSTWTKIIDASVLMGYTNIEHGSGAPSGAKTIPTYYIDTANGNIYKNAGGGSTWVSVFFPSLVYGTCNIETRSGVPSGARDILTYGIDLLTGDWYSNPGGGSSTWTIIVDSSALYGSTNWESGVIPPSGSRVIATYYIDTVTGAIYLNAGGGSIWSSIYNPSVLFYTEAEVDAKINILDTEFTDTWLLSAVGTKLTLPFPTLSATQGVEILSVVTYLDNKYTDGAASTNIVQLYYNGSAPDVFCTIENTAFMNDTRCEKATIDTSTEAKRMIYIGPTDGVITAIQAGGVNHMTGSTDHMKVKISYRIHDFA